MPRSRQIQNQTPEDVHLNPKTEYELEVGGVTYKTLGSSLTQLESLLRAQFLPKTIQMQDCDYSTYYYTAYTVPKLFFFDRDGHAFKYVMAFLRDGEKTVLPDDKFTLDQIKLEAEFFCLPKLGQMVEKIELVFYHGPTLPDRGKLNDPSCCQSIVLSFSQMLSVPDSFFWHLANNIINQTPKKLALDVKLAYDGRYYIKAGEDVPTMYFAKKVCEMLKFGKSDVGVYSVYTDEFLKVAELLAVPKAIEHGLKMKERK